MPKRSNRKKRHQIAAAPLRRAEDGSLQIVLVTSRETRRWILPKGWPMKGKTDSEAAATEAREEAGLVGAMLAEPIGTYSYWRRTKKHFRLTRVAVYVMAAEAQDADWKEKGQRALGWFCVPDAADLVSEPELCTLIAELPLNTRVDRFMQKNEPA